jgi:hypothetical protein
MKSQALQQFISQIFGNEETRKEFVKDPQTVLSRFPLTDLEKKAVLNTHAKMSIADGQICLDETVGPNTMWY